MVEFAKRTFRLKRLITDARLKKLKQAKKSMAFESIDEPKLRTVLPNTPVL